jgi:hypothetical protein
LSNHYLEFVVRCDNDSVTCTRREDAYAIYNQWIAAGYRGIILVRVDTHEEVLEGIG